MTARATGALFSRSYRSDFTEGRLLYCLTKSPVQFLSIRLKGLAHAELLSASCLLGRALTGFYGAKHLRMRFDDLLPVWPVEKQF